MRRKALRSLVLGIVAVGLLGSVVATGEDYWNNLEFAAGANALGSLILYESLPIVMTGRSVLEHAHVRLPDLEAPPAWMQQLATDVENLILWYDGDIEAIPRRKRIALVLRAIESLLPHLNGGMSRADIYRVALPGHDPLPISESISQEIILEPNSDPLPKPVEQSWWADFVDWVGGIL